MCKFFSAIITKENIYFDYDLDSHEDIIKKFNLVEGEIHHGFNFVRVELTPNDENLFNHNMDNWSLHVDQDYTPDWFNHDQIEDEVKIKLKEVIENRFVLGEMKEINQGRWFIGGSASVNYIRGSAKVDSIGGSASVNYIRDSAKVDYIGDSASVNYIRGSANILGYYNFDISNIKNIQDNALVINKNKDAIKIITSKGIIENIYDLIK